MLRKLTDIIKKIFPKNQFQKGVWWNFFSFIVLGIGGVLLNFLILFFWGPDVLGSFNQVYAVFILSSQFAVFGLYSPVLKFISQHSDNQKNCNEIISSALFLAFIITTAVSLIFYYLAPLIGRLMDSENVARGLLYAAPGLWLFSINKILLSFLNGKRQMKPFAIFYIMRYCLLPLSLAGLAIFHLPGYAVPVIFSVTEFIVCIPLLAYSSKFFSFTSPRACWSWFQVHLPFGAKSILSGGVTEINSRIDILMLGAFFSDKIVGIYSFAAMLAEGLDQIPVIFRVNYNPVLAKNIAEQKFSEIKVMVKGFLKKWMMAAVLVGILAISAYPLAVKIMSKSPELMAGWVVFAILVAGIVIKSGYSVFWDIPVQSGFPGHQAALIVAVSLSNVIMNSIMIPIWGMSGAAIATSLSFVLGIFYLKAIVKKTAQIAI